MTTSTTPSRTGVPDSGPWTTVAAAVAPASGAFANATGTVTYRKEGKTVFFRAVFNLVSNGTGAGSVNMTLPFTATGVEQNAIGREGLVTGKPVIGYVRGNILTAYNMDTTYPGGTGYVIYVSGVIEVV